MAARTRRPRSSFATEAEYLEFKRMRNAEYQRKYYWRKKNKTRKIPNFPHLLPYWDKWTPQLFRLMLRYAGLSFDRFEHVIYKKTFFSWEKEGFELNADLLQAITVEAEKLGWWHIAPFPPKLILVLARTPKDMISFCEYFRIPVGGARWIRHPRQLRDYTYTQVTSIAISNVKHLKGLHRHPVVLRFHRRCCRFQKRESLWWKPERGSSRSIPPVM